MSLDEIVRQATSRAGIIRVSNALNPLLWTCLLSPFAWVFAFLFQSDIVLRYGFAVLGACPFIGLMVAYFILLFRDPDRLQSEAFVIRQQELAIIERKSSPAARGVDLPVRTLPFDVSVGEEEGG